MSFPPRGGKSGRPREEEGPAAFFTRPQGGGGGLRIGIRHDRQVQGRYLEAVPSGRRRRAPPISETQGGGGVSGTYVLLPVGSLGGHAGDHRARDAQIREFAVRQALELANGFAEDLATSEGVAQASQKPVVRVVGDADILNQCHLRLLSIFEFVSGFAWRRLSALQRVPPLNTKWADCCDCTMAAVGIAAMQKTHGLFWFVLR